MEADRMTSPLLTNLELRQFVERMYEKLLAQSENAARRGKPTMWAYYRRMARHVFLYYLHPASTIWSNVLDTAKWVEQNARRMCLQSVDATDDDKATWYAYSVYARKIMGAAGEGERGWVKLWLRTVKEAPVG